MSNIVQEQVKKAKSEDSAATSEEIVDNALEDSKATPEKIVKKII